MKLRTLQFFLLAILVAGNSALAETEPAHVVAKVFSSRQINLSWQDDPSNRTGFQIQRCGDAEFKQNVVTYQLPARSTLCINTNLNPDTPYFYRVRNNDAPGDSGFSLVVQARTMQNIVPQTGQKLLCIPVIWGDSDPSFLDDWQDLTDVVAIAARGHHYLALRENGTVVGWGKEASLDIGDVQYNAGQVPPGLTGVIAIATGDTHSLALKSDGTVRAWGRNRNGQTNVPKGLSDVVAISAGEHINVALKRDGTVVGWGAKDFSKLTEDAHLKDIVAISTDDQRGIGIKKDGTAVIWGVRFHTRPLGFPRGLSDVITITGYNYHLLALMRNGKSASWAVNRGLVPTTATPGPSDVAAIAVGGKNLALKKDGTVESWGWDGYELPSDPVGLTNVVAIAAGANHCMALCRTRQPPADGMVTIGNYTLPTPKGFKLIIANPTGAAWRSEYGNTWVGIELRKHTNSSGWANYMKKFGTGMPITELRIGGLSFRRAIMANSENCQIHYYATTGKYDLLISGTQLLPGQANAVDDAVASLRPVRTGSGKDQPKN